MADKSWNLLQTGEYDAETEYTSGDFTTYLGSSYTCIATTTGNLPTDTDYWALVAEKGDIGETGATGATGATGSQGDSGVDGESFIWEGAWITSTLYQVNDVVSNTGSS